MRGMSKALGAGLAKALLLLCSSFPWNVSRVMALQLPLTQSHLLGEAHVPSWMPLPLPPFNYRIRTCMHELGYPQGVYQGRNSSLTTNTADKMVSSDYAVADYEYA